MSRHVAKTRRFWREIAEQRKTVLPSRSEPFIRFCALVVLFHWESCFAPVFRAFIFGNFHVVCCYDPSQFRLKYVVLHVRGQTSNHRERNVRLF